MDDHIGCEHCFPPSAEAAWAARGRLQLVADLVDDSHYHVMVLACRACGQGFVSVFTETIDWQDGDDPQYWQLLPIDAGESEALVRSGATVAEAALNALPGRRCLCLDHPKGAEQRMYWSKGLHVGFHD